MKIRSKNSKLLAAFPGKRVGSISRTPILNCPGAPPGGCTFMKANGKMARCYGINLGKRFPSVGKHWAMMDVLGADVWPLVADAITREMIEVFRPFTSGGDFTSQADVDAFYWCANQCHLTRFYTYSKALCFDLWSHKPNNVTIVQSRGGIYDHLIREDRPIAEVVAVGGSTTSEQDIVAGKQKILLTAH